MIILSLIFAPERVSNTLDLYRDRVRLLRPMVRMSVTVVLYNTILLCYIIPHKKTYQIPHNKKMVTSNTSAPWQFLPPPPPPHHIIHQKYHWNYECKWIFIATLPHKSLLNVLIAVLLFIFSNVYHRAKVPENVIRYISMGPIIHAKLGSQANTVKN
jgi:hypothetical protein